VYNHHHSRVIAQKAAAQSIEVKGSVISQKIKLPFRCAKDFTDTEGHDGCTIKTCGSELKIVVLELVQAVSESTPAFPSSYPRMKKVMVDDVSVIVSLVQKGPMFHSDRSCITLDPRTGKPKNMPFHSVVPNVVHTNKAYVPMDLVEEDLDASDDEFDDDDDDVFSVTNTTGAGTSTSGSAATKKTATVPSTQQKGPLLLNNSNTTDTVKNSSQGIDNELTTTGQAAKEQINQNNLLLATVPQEASKGVTKLDHQRFKEYSKKRGAMEAQLIDQISRRRVASDVTMENQSVGSSFQSTVGTKKKVCKLREGQVASGGRQSNRKKAAEKSLAAKK
jgi:hypothetical protein